jgi:hypothetical protein
MATDPPNRRTGKLAQKKGNTANDEIPDAIAKKLKALYDSVAQEPVPDRFTELLDQLDREKGDG